MTKEHFEKKTHNKVDLGGRVYFDLVFLAGGNVIMTSCFEQRRIKYSCFLFCSISPIVKVVILLGCATAARR